MITYIITRVRSYAILMAMYEHGYDYISCFVPVVLQFVPDYDYVNVTIIKHDLEEFIDLPELTIKKILNKAKEMNFVEVQETKEGDEIYQIKKGHGTLLFYLFPVSYLRTVDRRLSRREFPINLGF